jgi:hypothetical protein
MAKKKSERKPPTPRPVKEERTHYPVSPEKFALIWNSCESAEEAAEKLEMPKPIVLARVSNYRQKGVRLKKMRRKNSRRLDVEKINQIIETQNNSFVDNSTPVAVERFLVLADNTVTTPQPRALSVRSYLFDGTPEGLRMVERLHSTVRAISCSKLRLRQAKSRPEFQKPSVYVLIGPPDSGLPRIYIGEGDPAWPRLEHHLIKKHFWESLTLFTSKDDALHKAHIQFLESQLTSLARQAGRCQLENGNNPQLPTLSHADVVEAEAFLDEVRLLCPFLGLTVFESSRPDEMETRPGGARDE